MKYFLGIEIAKFEAGVVLSQWKFVLDLLSDTGMSGCKPLSIPMVQNLKLMPFQEGKDNPTRSLRDAATNNSESLPT